MTESTPEPASSNFILNPQKIVQEVMVSKKFIQIQCPSRMVISGPSLSGKSHFCLKLIKFRQQVYSEKFERVLYCLPENSIHLHHQFIQKLKDICDFVEIVEGLPDINDLNLGTGPSIHKLLIMDDLMTRAFASNAILELITSTSHHSSISVVITTQSIFLPSKHRLTLLRNCSEKVIFHDKIDHNQLQVLSRHVTPGKPNFLKDCFEFIYKNTKKGDLKYVLLDASPLSDLPYNACIRTFVFPHDDGIIRPVFFSSSE